MDKEQEEFFKKNIEIINWFNNYPEEKSIPKDILNECKNSRLSENKNIIFGGYDNDIK